jgi:FixJ family two-component response regulator
MRTSQPTIAIIDDDASVRSALGRLVRAAGLGTTTFASAEQFLEACGSAPALLVLDVHLPGLSGLELQARLNAEGRGLPVVFITAYADEPLRQAALAAGCAAFLPKPFEEQELLGAIREALAAGWQ